MGVIVALKDLSEADRDRAGDKACRLATIARSGLAVPPALCVTTDAYRVFVDAHRIRASIRLELARKSFEDMRWEEIWDAGLRIRNRFLHGSIPAGLRDQLASAVEATFGGTPVVVRSSAPGEDGRGASFAGLHDSFVNVAGARDVLRHLPMVWASLWSDRALLYRRELGLDVDSSSMAVIIQELVPGGRSGVAFSRKPGEPTQSVVEAVYGLNQGLVDGTIEPDRWILERSSGRVLEHHQPAERRCLNAAPDGAGLAESIPPDPDQPPLGSDELTRVAEAAERLESLFGSPQDVEWTFLGDRLLVLQSRPITAGTGAADGDQRPWYLSLHRSFESLQRLRRTVEEERLPALESETRQLARCDLGRLSDADLEDEINRRVESHERWVETYWQEFIPLAHGIRLFGQVYNDVMCPDDPYEFMDLLSDADLRGVRRNRRLDELAARLRTNPELAAALSEAGPAAADPGLAADIRAFLDEFGTMAYGDAQCFAEQGRLIRLLLELAARTDRQPVARTTPDRDALTAAFFDRCAGDGRVRARELLDLARASYRLRDDDNLYIGALKAEVLRATEEAWRRSARVGTGEADGGGAEAVPRLRDPNLAVEPPPREVAVEPIPGFSLHPRQLVGQPASPGVARGRARVVRSAGDLFELAAGEVLVCDAIDPNMTFVIPLAAAIVERRGGMLIHGAIIAREYGIPCVTGIRGATDAISSGTWLTVDGFLGIVTVG